MLRLPFESPPAPGELIEVSEGVLWGRMPLPFRLDHVNVYILRDGDGWLIFDTGLADEGTKALWERLLQGPLKGGRITGILASHHHPDHIGLAGWLAECCNAPLLTSTTSFLFSLNLYHSPELMATPEYLRFYASHGLSEEVVRLMSGFGDKYLELVDKPAPTYRRLKDGGSLAIDGQGYDVLTGDGHCPEQVMLMQQERRLFFSADQVLQRISPHISVQASEPQGDPLGRFLASLTRLKQTIAEDTLVLPGHHMPFYGLHERVDELQAHHAGRCDILRDACAGVSLSVADLLPKLFPRVSEPRDTAAAFTEALAHVNYLVERGELRWQENAGKKLVKSV